MTLLLCIIIIFIKMFSYLNFHIIRILRLIFLSTSLVHIQRIPFVPRLHLSPLHMCSSLSSLPCSLPTLCHSDGMFTALCASLPRQVLERRDQQLRVLRASTQRRPVRLEVGHQQLLEQSEQVLQQARWMLDGSHLRHRLTSVALHERCLEKGSCSYLFTRL